MPAFLIGGFVRDKIIGRPTKDADIVCMGDGIALATKVAQHFHPKPHVSFFKNFGTAHIRVDDFEIEFVAQERKVTRPKAVNPMYYPELEEDQNRRDFTINALAISLNEHGFGDLVDPFNGLSDIEIRL